MRLGLVLPLGLLWAVAPINAMQPLSPEELDAVTGQEGIAFEWDLRINANEDGSPDASLPLVERRIALSIAERTNEWLVFKGFTGRIYFPTFFLDAGRSPNSPSGYADIGRFIDGLGLPVNPYGAPNLTISFPEDVQIWNLTIAAMSLENDNSPLMGVPGYLQDPTDSRSFLGLSINNSIAGTPATVNVEGSLRLFGF
jgi:hypothetical protein